jgi:excisionase family DNA binding protein
MKRDTDRRTTEAPPSWEPLQTPLEAARFLRLHPKTVVRMARNKTIPAIRLGKHWRFRFSDLSAWAANELQLHCQPDE